MSNEPPTTPPPPPEQPSGSGAPNPAAQQAKGFFGALFDFNFDHFITPMIVKAVYLLALVFLVLGWLSFLVAGFAQGSGTGLFVLILGPVLVVLYLAFIRMTLEFYLAIVRMSEDIHRRLPKA